MSKLKGSKLIMMNLLYVVIGLIVLRVADPFKWWVPGPEEVAKEFLKAVENGNYSKAKKYCDEGTKAEIDRFAEIVDYAEYNYVSIYDVIKEEDVAMVTYDLGYASDEYVLDLVKKDHEWKAVTTANLLLTRYEDEETYDAGEYEWSTIETGIDANSDYFSFPGEEGDGLSNEEAEKLVNEFMKELEKMKSPK